MPTLVVQIDQTQANDLEEVLNRNPGWTKTLVVRALLAYFLKLEMAEQETFVKKHRVKSKR